MKFNEHTMFQLDEARMLRGLKCIAVKKIMRMYEAGEITEKKALEKITEVLKFSSDDK